VDFGAAVVADEQAFEVVQPGEGALDDPPGGPEPGAVPSLRRAISGLIPCNAWRSGNRRRPG
jgi:hypothetical protein